MTSAHAEEVQTGKRFAFGKNWESFLATVNQERIDRAKESLCTMLECDSLAGKRFLDVGSGSGLSSLAAHELGASVVSFDFDPDSVACTRELKNRYANSSDRWIVLEGSVLDEPFVASLGSFDVVYSWGVLHHTGALYDALSIAIRPLNSDGRFFIAIYNDQGVVSKIWKRVKQIYCGSRLGRMAMKLIFIPYFFLVAVIAGIVRYGLPWGRFTRYRQERGMSIYHDWLDWLGGYPFDVAKPEEIIEWCRQRNLRLFKMKTTKRLGCNEFVMQRVDQVEKSNT